MLFKKSKAFIAAVLSAAMATNAMVATVASAAGDRKKPEAFGDSTYAERFLSMYDDVMTNGVENGYLSENGSSNSSFGIPFHSVEEVIIEAPDYGHETTSEAMSYLVWVAAMRDNIAQNHADQVGTSVTNTNDLAKAWKTMENMIPTVQDNFWGGSVSAQYCGEYDMPDQCPDEWASEPEKTAENPIHSYFTSAYSGQKGLYLMHWLADVENWYGFGTGTDFTFINTFQRGEQESCWETVPHPCIEEKKYGNPDRGMKGIFNRDEKVTEQYAYTNAPDAEDRAIQAVFDSIKWGVDDSSINANAAMMGDELRNNFFDKYYQEIGENTSWTNGNAGYDSAHFLRNWYTSWGGALSTSGQNWVWQIGCSHSHQFYQNPLAAYALLTDSTLSGGMKAQKAEEDYTTSLQRQLEMYLWLQSPEGPFAGGCTNSYKGRYESYPSGISTFYGMAYTEHPVYADPGSNHWIGNQVWSTQRLAELYYWVCKDGDNSGVKPGGMSIEDALDQMLSRWVAWFVNNSVLTDDGDYYMPSNLDWSGQPDTWGGSSSDNSGLSCTISGYGNTDLGCISSLANSLIYFAKAKGVTGADLANAKVDCIGSEAKSGIVDGVTNGNGNSISVDDADLGATALYLAKELLDREWELGRDDIGMNRTENNGSLARFFCQPVHVPSSYSGTMPNGDAIENGATFLSLRSMYEDASKCKGAKTSDEAIELIGKLRAAYEKDTAAGAEWSGQLSASSEGGRKELADFKNVGAVPLEYHRFWHAGDILMAHGVMATLYGDELTPGPVGVTPGPGDDPVDPGKLMLGDVNVDGEVDIRDVLVLNQNLLAGEKLTEQGILNADVDQDGSPSAADALAILQYTIGLVKSFPV